MEFTENNNMNIKIENIPSFLKSSNLYRSFEEFDDNIIVPFKYFTNEISIKSKEDLSNTLEILRYWMVDTTPWAIYEYFITNSNVDYTDIIEKFYDLFIIEEIKIILEYNEYLGGEHDLTHFVIKSKHGSINLFEYALTPQISEINKKKILCEACFFGNLEILIYCHNLGYKHVDLEYILATKNGNDKCLQFLFDNNVPYPKDSGCLDDDLFQEEFESVIYHDINPYKMAAGNGHIECLKCLVKNNAPKRYDLSDLYSENVLPRAISSGNIDCLKFLIENGWPKSNILINFAIEESELTSEVKLEIVKYLHSVGCEFNNSCVIAAKYGLIDCLKFAHTNGCELTYPTLLEACEFGSVECLNYAHENGFELYNRVIRTSIINNNLNCLEYCHKHGLKLQDKYCNLAAENGSFDCLKYCHENGCKINDDVINRAMEIGHFECVKYAHMNGANLPSRLPNLVFMRRNNDIIKYYNENKKN